MRGPASFLGEIVTFAVRGSVLLTDRLSIVIGPFVTLGLRAAGRDVGDSVSDTIAIGIAITVATVIALRFLCAPYFIWRAQNKCIVDLEAEIASPELIERKWLAEYVAETRAKLARALADLSVMSHEDYIWNGRLIGEDTSRRHKEYFAARSIVKALSDELSYLPELRENCLTFVNRCDILIDQHKRHEDSRETRKELYLLQRELFRTLHRR